MHSYRWLSKAQSTKMVGSLVLWLKKRRNRGKLPAPGGPCALGATGYFVSVREKRDMWSLCFNCHQQRHRQASCSAPAKCGHCSGPHRTSTCDNQQHLKYPRTSQVRFQACAWHHRAHVQPRIALLSCACASHSHLFALLRQHREARTHLRHWRRRIQEV